MVQHYPLYRVSDAGCTGLDAAPAEDRHLLFREKYDVLSKEASQRVRATPLTPPSLYQVKIQSFVIMALLAE